MPGLRGLEPLYVTHDLDALSAPPTSCPHRHVMILLALTTLVLLLEGLLSLHRLIMDAQIVLTVLLVDSASRWLPDEAASRRLRIFLMHLLSSAPHRWVGPWLS